MCLCVARACRHHLSCVHPYRVGVQSEPGCSSPFYLPTSEVRCLPCLGARPRPQPRTGPATCRANWLVGGRRRRRRIVVSSGQCMQLCVRPELVARADACAVLRTWFSRRGRPRGETSREHSRQGPQGVPRDHTAFSISSGFRAPCSPLGARFTRHTVSPETLPCPSIVKCDLVCKCHLRTAVHL